MQGDREHAELANDVINRPLEKLSQIRPPYWRQPGAGQSRPTDQIKVNLSEGAKYKRLYSQYAQGVDAASPVNKTLGIARNAARDGQPTEVIVNILRNDPKAQQFGEKSEQFIQTVTQSAVRKTQVEKSAQPAHQQQKTPTLER